MYPLQNLLSFENARVIVMLLIFMFITIAYSGFYEKIPELSIKI